MHVVLPTYSASHLRQKYFWIGLLYFVEGLPFGIVKDVWPLYFRSAGVSLVDLGLMSLLGLPWTLKVLWSPLIDRFGQLWHWMFGALVVMAACSVAITGFDAAHPSWALWTILFCFVCASATQDIAIDAYSIGLLGRGEEGYANGVRLAAYRIALITGGGGLAIVGGKLGWNVAHLAAAGALVTLAVIVTHSPRLNLERSEHSDQSFMAIVVALKRWLLRPGMGWALVVILTYRLGDAALGPMVKPFWLDRGATVAEIGTVSTSFGVGFTIIGALIGGYVITRIGLWRSLWVLGLAQAASNLGYWAVANWLTDFQAQRWLLYSASMMESLTGGLGSAAFLAFMMRLCGKQQAAVQYAALSALFALTRDVSGALSGWGAQSMGYASYFMLTAVLGAAALLLLPGIRSLIVDADAGPAA